MKSKASKKKRKRDQDDSDEADEFSESDSELGEPKSRCHSVLLSVYMICTEALYCVRMHKLCVCIYNKSLLGSGMAVTNKAQSKKSLHGPIGV